MKDYKKYLHNKFKLREGYSFSKKPKPREIKGGEYAVMDYNQFLKFSYAHFGSDILLTNIWKNHDQESFEKIVWEGDFDNETFRLTSKNQDIIAINYKNGLNETGNFVDRNGASIFKKQGQNSLFLVQSKNLPDNTYLKTFPKEAFIGSPDETMFLLHDEIIYNNSIIEIVDQKKRPLRPNTPLQLGFSKKYLGETPLNTEFTLPKGKYVIGAFSDLLEDEHSILMIAFTGSGNTTSARSHQVDMDSFSNDYKNVLNPDYFEHPLYMVPVLNGEGYYQDSDGYIHNAEFGFLVIIPEDLFQEGDIEEYALPSECSGKVFNLESDTLVTVKNQGQLISVGDFFTIQTDSFDFLFSDNLENNYRQQVDEKADLFYENENSKQTGENYVVRQ